MPVASSGRHWVPNGLGNSKPSARCPADNPTEAPDRTSIMGTQETDRWQDRLLPVMKGLVIMLTAFFFLVSLIQLFLLQREIRQAPPIGLTGGPPQ